MTSSTVMTRMILTWLLVLAIAKHIRCQDTVAYEGNTAVINCLVLGDYTFPNWFGPPNTMAYYSGASNIFNPTLGAKRDRLSINANNRSLQLTNVMITDEGTYTCVALDQIQHNEVQIRIAPTELETNVSTMQDILGVRVKEGWPLTVTCTSKGGYPAPHVAWYKGNITGQKLKENANGINIGTTYTVTVSHTFNTARKDDRTKLVCRSYYPTPNNAQGSQERTITLYLYLKPLQHNFPLPDTAVTGGNVTATCTTTGSRPAANISWIYDGQTYEPSVSITESKSSQTFTVVSVFERPVTARDNGQSAQCSVAHMALTNTLTETRQFNVEFPVELSTSSITGKSAIEANGYNELKVTCKTGSSNPASGVTWKIGPDIISNNNSYTDTLGVNNGVVRSQVLSLRPTRYDDGNTISCSVSNGVGQVKDITSVTLNLTYSPITADMSDMNVIEGDSITLKCNASSKPVAIFTWKKGSATVAQGTGTDSYNGYDYTISTVNRNQAGTYTCTADNQLSRTDSKQTRLTVLYPPDINVFSVNTTVNSLSTTVTCEASGVPDQYTYERWVHMWGGNIVIHPVSLPGTKVLTLTDLSYAHSGVYTCGASNGVKGVSSGSGGLLVKSPPVIIGIVTQTKEITLLGQLYRPYITSFQLYSNAGLSTVRVYSTKRTMVPIDVQLRDVDVQLPVFLSTITTQGTEATLSITVREDSQFGPYDILVTNEVGAVNISLVLKPLSTPEPPFDISIVLVRQAVKVTWKAGSPNGLNQTFVIQLSTDNSTWRDISQYGGLSYQQTHQKRISDLRANQLYYIRMLSENDIGKSTPTGSITFTTEALSEMNTGSSSGWVLGGVTSGLLLILAIACVIYFVILRRKGLSVLGERNNKERFDKRDERFQTEGITEKEKTDNKAIATGTTSEASEQYETLQNTDDKRLYAQLKTNKSSDNPHNHENVGLSTYESLQRDQDNEQRTYEQLQCQGSLPTDYENLKVKTTV